MKRSWLAVALLVLSLAPGAEGGVIPLDLRFDGQPIETAAPPDFTCFNATANRWVSCGVKRGEGPGAWVLEGLEPGRYRLHVSIDENPVNPRRFPGDYEAQHRFEVTERGPERLTVDMVRLIHLTRPGDNARSLEGMLTSCATQPVFETPRHSWGPTARIEFAWDPIVAGTEYRVSVTAVSCSQPDRQREVLRTMTGANEVALSLPPSVGDERYYFWIAAWRDGRLVGDLYTHDAGVHSWNYRFQVRNASLPRWVYVVGAGLVVLLVIGAIRFLPTAPATRRRRLARRALVLTIVGVLAGGAYYVVRDRVEEGERRRAEEERIERGVGLGIHAAMSGDGRSCATGHTRILERQCASHGCPRTFTDSRCVGSRRRAGHREPGSRASRPDRSRGGIVGPESERVAADAPRAYSPHAVFGPSLRFRADVS